MLGALVMLMVDGRLVHNLRTEIVCGVCGCVGIVIEIMVGCEAYGSIGTEVVIVVGCGAWGCNCIMVATVVGCLWFCFV